MKETAPNSSKSQRILIFLKPFSQNSFVDCLSYIFNFHSILLSPAFNLSSLNIKGNVMLPEIIHMDLKVSFILFSVDHKYLFLGMAIQYLRWIWCLIFRKWKTVLYSLITDGNQFYVNSPCFVNFVSVENDRLNNQHIQRVYFEI